MHKILDSINIHIYKFIEWVGAGLSFLLFQAGIPLEIHVLTLNPILASLLHGIVSMLVPVGSFYLIHVFKKLLEDKESWASKANECIIRFVSFKWLKK